ncbi:methyltransferase [Belnapia sp. T6]|uniref:Methyltransferase n=1 Tax=Belnapia mucosa TaxID=2804532 RepID=A0ABS1V5V9_9PROT|nr:methyltransferase domain-containing protein [Belnapia mucosa]MBL6456094.1 methyltransferase [Belnapia mucosa]
MTEAWTEDRLLGGRVALRQPRVGLRAGLDAVLLAAGIPARPDQAVLEAGCGSGAAFLCLAARVPGLRITAIERDPALATLARTNAAANGLAAEVLEGDVRDLALARRLPPCDQAFANPPFWATGTAPPAAQRGTMTHAAEAGAATLADWACFLAASLVRRGTLGLILPTARLEAGMAALAAAGCGGTLLLPFWPREGQAAKRVLLLARRGGRGPARITPGLVLHGPEGGFTPAAEAVLREAAPLPV